MFSSKIDPKQGHGLSKHGPKDLKAYLETAKKLQSKNSGKGVSWFRSQKDMDLAVQMAKKWMHTVLKDQDKATKFAEFLANPKEGVRFGFRFPIKKNSGRGLEKLPDGTLKKLRDFPSAYIDYSWKKAKNDKWEIFVKTVYPRMEQVSLPK